jgi:hypothetical protein
MKSKWMVILGSLAVLMLSGCATMSGDECATSDWQAIGFEDGSRGYSADRLGNHRKACAKHGVTPDFQAYQTGHDQGLNSFCQPSRGFSLGSNGGSYNGVCAAHREGDFVDAYNSGYHLYNLRSRVNSASSQINYKKNELENNEKSMTEKEVALISPDTLIEERIRIIADLKNISEDNGQLEAEIDQLIHDRAKHEHELESYEAILANSGY